MTAPRGRARGDEPTTPWRPPTRRTFVAMLGAAAAALVGSRHAATVASASPREPSPALPRWIGHC